MPYHTMIPLILLISLTLLNLFSPLLVLAQARSGAPFQAPASVKYEADIDEFLNAGAQYYIAWQFSGDKSNPIENDAYSFYKDGPTCAILKTKAAKYPGQIGVNIHALSNKTDAQITALLSSAKNNCGATIVRFWGFDNPANITKVLRIANGLGIKAIVALVDFGTIALNPVTWYSASYKSSYQAHALEVADAINAVAGLQSAVYALELANEPHCFGLITCLAPYNNWARDMSNLLANKGFKIGIGQKASENTTRGDSPGVGSPPDFQASNNSTSISVASGHYYNPGEKALVLTALAISKSLGQAFYIGEAGSTGESSTSVISTPIRPTARPTMRPCTTEDNPEFHPLRPYPGEPCDPLIPRSIPSADKVIPKSSQDFATQLSQDYQMRNSVAFSCGNSLDPNTPEQFDIGLGKPFNPGVRGQCENNNGHVTCYLRENFDLTLDLTNANIPILGNTQTSGLTDAQKMTEYLSWYLNGTVQQSEQNPNPSISRLVNFSGPLQKLLAFDLKNAVRSWLVEGPAGEKFAPPAGGGQYHNYIVGCNQVIGVNLGDYIQAVKQIISAVVGNIGSAVLIGAKIVDVGKDAAVPLGTALLRAAVLLPDKKAAIFAFRDSFFAFISDPRVQNKALDAAGFILDQGSDIAQRIGVAFSSIAKVAPNQAVVCTSAMNPERIKSFKGVDIFGYPKLPPDPAREPDFATYNRKLLQWYGYTFLGVGNFGIYVPPLNPNVWSQLFRDISFSSLEDTTGEVVISVSPDTHANQQDKDVVDAQDQAKSIPSAIVVGQKATLKLIIKAKH